MVPWTSLKMGHIELKIRSAGQIIEKPCVYHRDNIDSLVLFKGGQNVRLDDIFGEFENGSCWVKN